MINVYKVTKFTCPRTIFQLSCHMLRNAESRENGHLLKTQFDNFCIRVVVPELLECLDKGLNRLFTALLLSLPKLINVGGILLLFFFLFSILGVQLFAKQKYCRWSSWPAT